MEKEINKNRTLWIVIGVIVALLALCGLVAVTAAAFLVITGSQVDVDDPGAGLARVTDRTERSFNVGADPTLEIDNFAGPILIRAGEPGIIRVVATRRANGRSNLEDIDLSWDEGDNRVGITTRVPRLRASNRSVAFEIEVPQDARVVVDNGAGEIIIDGVQGELDVHTGAGDLRTTGALAGGRLDTGAGAIQYAGAPVEDLVLETGAGSITIFLPRDAAVELDLDTGVGSIDVDDFAVTGEVSARDVEGTIGAGGPTIEAHTGAGGIDVRVLE